MMKVKERDDKVRAQKRRSRLGWSCFYKPPIIVLKWDIGIDGGVEGTIRDNYESGSHLQSREGKGEKENRSNWRKGIPIGGVSGNSPRLTGK